MKLAVTGLALLALAPAPADTIVFGPKEGTKLEKRFEIKMELAKRAITMSVDGEELPDELTEDAVMDMDVHDHHSIVDEYRKIEGDRPLVLARRFVELTKKEDDTFFMIGMPEAQAEKKTTESKLSGKTVLFRWNAEEDAYDKEWDGDEGDDELLEGLEEDMDLRRILPGKPVSDGDTWTIDLKEFDEILGPGGRLGFTDEEDDEDFESNLKGEAICTYAGTKTVEGRKLARITAVCKAQTALDEEEDGSRMHMTFDFQFEGEFLWDVEARHLASYELGGEITAVLEVREQLEEDGESGEFAMKVDLAGKLEIEGEFTRP